jgi:hypothetical protein
MLMVCLSAVHSAIEYHYTALAWVCNPCLREVHVSVLLMSVYLSVLYFTTILP